jgi:hypothetical protein
MKTINFIKKHAIIAMAAVSLVLLSGCGISSGLHNQFSVNGANTNVVLQKNNFKVLGSVNGTSEATYVLGVGLNKNTLIAQAKQQMLDNAKLDGSSKAVINVTVEEHVTFILVYVKRTVKVHGTIIEFTE